jgi:hypothetical protein
MALRAFFIPLTVLLIMVQIAIAVPPRVNLATYSLRSYSSWAQNFWIRNRGQSLDVQTAQSKHDAAAVVTDFDQDIFVPSTCQTNPILFVSASFVLMMVVA